MSSLDEVFCLALIRNYCGVVAVCFHMVSLMKSVAEGIFPFADILSCTLI